MSNTKEIKRKISSVKNTAKITKTMELISTIKMKKAQDLALLKKEYIKSIFKIFLDLNDSIKNSHFFSDNISNKKTLGVLITSNKGLCGAYNINVMKKVLDYTQNNKDENIDFVSIGKKGSNFLARTGNNIILDYSSEFIDDVSYSFSKSISKMLTKKYVLGEYGRVVIFYNYYVNTIKQIPLTSKFLSLSKDSIYDYFYQILGENYYNELLEIDHSQDLNDYYVEPSRDRLLNYIMPMILDSMFYDILLESKASEHSARMIAMKNAKDNANNYAYDLTLEYNKERQAYITKEVGEIVSGVESMKD
ncbi:ATP synthase F1 subunit gamma [Candidatus Vampirococcus lugosii]|uniref:ATP synthase gamma chain n=1 Tax=Candidatus Vampirococcus lugosii TaxID=2789015 RepID=A0ABS5QKM1_9BACT|nr:ATP synthase F1 subunit gamma [Candidatus Vampirococcus lugosii]MBS8121775.1 ATP synthase gamma chain [Candidatus Vampirococcus lugosii]